MSVENSLPQKRICQRFPGEVGHNRGWPWGVVETEATATGTYFDASNACWMSSMMSSTFSIPTDTQTDQTWINACLPELLIGELTVSMACRMQNAGSRIGNMGYDGCQFQLIHELASCLTTAL